MLAVPSRIVTSQTHTEHRMREGSPMACGHMSACCSALVPPHTIQPLCKSTQLSIPDRGHLPCIADCVCVFSMGSVGPEETWILWVKPQLRPVLQWCICVHLALLSLVLVFSSFPGPASSLGLGALAVFQPQPTGRLKSGPTLMVHTDPALLRPTARQPPPSFQVTCAAGLPPRSVDIGCGHPFSHPST